jgi:hypothetical protein
MRTERKSRTRRKFGWNDTFNKRAYAACVCLACAWLLIHFRDDIAALDVRTAIVQDSRSDLVSGSILVIPRDGSKCRQRLIDNDTWRTRDNGVVDCTAAVAENTERWHERMANQRTTAIRDSFVKN